MVVRIHSHQYYVLPYKQNAFQGLFLQQLSVKHYQPHFHYYLALITLALSLELLLQLLSLPLDRKSTRLNSSHVSISYAVFCTSSPSFTLFPYTTLFRSIKRWWFEFTHTNTMSSRINKMLFKAFFCNNFP